MLNCIQNKVSNDMNTMLLHRFTEIEVVSSMKQMAPLKALGLDGMPPVFYQSYWHVVGLDVIQAYWIA